MHNKEAQIISISDIRAGWLTLSIGNYSYRCSYLHDIIEELDDLFFDRVNSLDFDCEGTFLHIMGLKYYDGTERITLYITCPIKEYKENYVIDCDFNLLMKQWAQLKEEIKEDYNINFKLHYEEEGEI